jgi:hypothetical protein
MPTKLPPRTRQPKQEYVFPLLSMIAAILALLLVLAEAQAMRIIDFGTLDSTLLSGI